MGRKPMKERMYRESRLARVLGDPAKYAIINLLITKGPMGVREIARTVRRAESTASHHLAQLRNVELVRYEVKTIGVSYWIKYRAETRTILGSLKRFVRRARRRIENDT
jgi:DNA-binding transcriptional ArsR family regulator